MKFGFRKPSFSKSFSASTKGVATRALRKAIIPDYGKRGGIYTNPKKAAYNSLYHVTTVGANDVFRSDRNRARNENGINYFENTSDEYLPNSDIETSKENINKSNRNYNILFYVLAICCPVTGMITYLFAGFWMFFSVLIFGFLEALCCIFIMSLEDHTNILHPLRTMTLNVMFCSLLLTLNLYPFIFRFIHTSFVYQTLYEGGVLSSFLSILLVLINLLMITTYIIAYTEKKSLIKNHIDILKNIDGKLLELEKSKASKQSYNIDYQIGLFDFKVLDNIESAESLRIINTRIANIKGNKLINTCLDSINALTSYLNCKYNSSRLFYLLFPQTSITLKNKIDELSSLKTQLVDAKKETKLNITFPEFPKFDQLEKTGITLQNNSYFFFQSYESCPIRNDMPLWASLFEELKISKETNAFEYLGLKDNFLFFNEKISIMFYLSAIIIILPHGLYLFKYNELTFEYNEVDIICDEALDTCKGCDIIGYHWKHSTMKGSPDLRYNYNPQCPIIKHGLCKIKFKDNSEINIISSDLSNIKLFTSILCD